VANPHGHVRLRALAQAVAQATRGPSHGNHPPTACKLSERPLTYACGDLQSLYVIPGEATRAGLQVERSDVAAALSNGRSRRVNLCHRSRMMLEESAVRPGVSLMALKTSGQIVSCRARAS